MANENSVISDVVARGLCTGCGTCVGVCPLGALAVGEDEEGEYVPVERDGLCNSCGECLEPCPGVGFPFPAFEERLFGRQRTGDLESRLGILRSTWAAHSADPQVRLAGASGGTITGMCKFLLESGTVDGAIVTAANPEKPYRYLGKVARTPQDLIGTSQSRYSMVPSNAVLRQALELGLKKLVVVGLPCHLQAVRKLQASGSDLGKICWLTIGMPCAQEFYFEGTYHLLREVLKVESLDDVTSLEYLSGEWPGDFVVRLKDGSEKRMARHDYTQHFLYPGYKIDRCEMCLDWGAEVADLAAGDYRPGGRRATNGVMVRTERGEAVWNAAFEAGAIVREPVDPASIMGAPGFEFKRHGATLRYLRRKRHGWPVPDFGGLDVKREVVPRTIHIVPGKQ